MMYGLQPTAANFYPRPPRGGRRAILTAGKRYRKISIHALRKEGDAAHGVNPRKMLISIHALRKEGDEPVFCRYRRRQGFLSTPSARRATRQSHYGHCQHEISIHALRKEGDPAGVNPTRKGEHFYPRPPQGGRRYYGESTARSWNISIHALRKEGDQTVSILLMEDIVFLSTPSARRATTPLPGAKSQFEHFYPRPPQGGRLYLLPAPP